MTEIAIDDATAEAEAVEERGIYVVEERGIYVVEERGIYVVEERGTASTASTASINSININDDVKGNFSRSRCF